MLRFSCFNSHINGQKTKKQAHPSFETMANDQLSRSKDLESLQRSSTNERSDCNSRNDLNSSQVDFLPGCDSNLGALDTDLISIIPLRQFRRSLSLGCNLQEEVGRVSEENNSDDHTGQGYSCDGSHDQLHHVSTARDHKSPAGTPVNQDYEDASVEPPNFSCAGVNNESIFSISDQQYPWKECIDNCDVQMDADGAVDSGIHTPRCPSLTSKSYSLPNLPSMLSRSGGFSPCTFSAYHNRSSDDLNVVGIIRKETSVHDVSAQQYRGRNEDIHFCKSDKNDGQNGVPDGYGDSYNYAASNKDWIVPAFDDEVYGVQSFQGESSHHLDQLPNADFKIKRIENWVTDLQECGPVEEMDELPIPLDQGNTIIGAKEDASLNSSMQAAKKYISSLNTNTTAAQLTNHGLAVIPFLSVFASLKVVNLSGNSIVKITAGALPRGLHMLNLSKNKISTIEGLRELTRLRILDLSYNRITRIGHGLASCSTLKELYLAGNKISEVEGLHRLLKLAVLDFRFNKISTSNGLGQLAANYNSLQAISLEGNPAQKNVGDEQLKKHLQGLLPHLAYYNRQSIKSSSLKAPSDRSVRLGMAAHQSDRGHKSEHKPMRRASHSSSTLKQSGHGYSPKGQPVDPSKRSRSKQGGHIPPSGTRSSTNRHHHHHQAAAAAAATLELNMKPLVLPDFSMKKSHSMGALTAN